MMYARYALYAPLSLGFNIFVILFSPLLAGYVAIANNPHPSWMRWCYSDDDDIFGSGMTKEPVPGTVWGRFKRALWWLCRNPGFGFAKNVIGRPNPCTIYMLERSTFPEWDSGTPTIERFVAVTEDGRRWFNYRRDVPLPMSKYCKLWFGWQDDGRLKIMFNPFLTSRGNQ